jgi:RNA polymerase sigma-70 factor (ECF subfamily)
LQQLSAIERAVFLLREIFQYPYNEIADMVGKTNTHCRQIFYRAKKSIDNKPPTKTASAEMKLQVQQFVQLLLEGNMDRLKELVTQDVVHYTDGGGKVQAVLHPVRVISKVLFMYKQWMKWFKEPDQAYTYQFTEVNGDPGFVMTIGKQVTYVYSFEMLNERIQSIFTVANPDKLKHLHLIQ